MGIQLDNNHGYRWNKEQNIYVRGNFFCKGVYYNDTKMIDVFNGINSIVDFSEKLNSINGFFSVVIETDQFIFAATDRVSTTPIFFKQSKNDLLLTDDYSNILSNDDEMHEESMIEYLKLGYVTGNNTLYSNVKQLKPGEILSYDKYKHEIRLERYYEYHHLGLTNLSENELVEKLHNVHKNVFSRFVESLKGRKVIVPLSGGYDSRLIVEMLKVHDYRNVLCLTWGKKTDWQVKIAKDVAYKLGYEWICIDHSRKEWFEWFNSNEYKESKIITGAISSIPYLQESIAINHLEKVYSIPKDSIFVSGNSGDFVEGEHIPSSIIGDGRVSADELVESIYKKHFRLFRLRNEKFEDELKNKLLRSLQIESVLNSEQAASIFEYWEWQERQSKFVTNCIKSFELKGYEWRMPLWDNEIMNFWSKVPVKLRFKRKLFLEYSSKYMDNKLAYANPKLSKIKIYKERLTDNRYGCFNGGYNIIKGLLLKDEKIFSDPILDLIEKNYIVAHKLNGLIALWNLIDFRKNNIELSIKMGK